MSTTPTPTPATTTAAPTTLDAKTIELVQLVVKSTVLELQQPTTATAATIAAPDTERKAAGAQYISQLNRK